MSKEIYIYIYVRRSQIVEKDVGILLDYTNWIPRKYHASNSIPCRLNCPYEN